MPGCVDYCYKVLTGRRLHSEWLPCTRITCKPKTQHMGGTSRSYPSQWAGPIQRGWTLYLQNHNKWKRGWAGIHLQSLQSTPTEKGLDKYHHWGESPFTRSVFTREGAGCELGLNVLWLPCSLTNHPCKSSWRYIHNYYIGGEATIHNGGEAAITFNCNTDQKSIPLKGIILKFKITSSPSLPAKCLYFHAE